MGPEYTRAHRGREPDLAEPFQRMPHTTGAGT